MFVVVSWLSLVLWGIDRVNETLKLFCLRLVQATWVELGHMAWLVRRNWGSCVLFGHVCLLVAKFTLSILLSQSLRNVVASVANLGVLVTNLRAECILQLQISYEIFLVVVLQAACQRPTIYVVE
jgi:hypothetical protein